MGVLRHQDITNDFEMPPRSQFVESSNKVAAKTLGVEETGTAVGAGGQVVKVVARVVMTLSWHVGILPR